MGIAPEDRLLIACSRTRVGEDVVAAALPLLFQQLDWDYVVEASIAHGVSPLFFRGLNQVLERTGEALECVPGHVLENLNQLYQGNRLRNERLLRVAGDVLRAFAAEKVEALGLKDLHLTWAVYPDPGFRPMGDLDILIRKEDYRKVSRCLAALGFLEVGGADIPYTLKYASGLHFRRAADNVWLDIQWNVMDREWDHRHEGEFTFDPEDLWERSRQLGLDGAPLRVPSPEDMLFHLCLHLEGHKYCELILFCDIVELLDSSRGLLDWKYFIELTRRYRAESSVYYVLFLVRHLFQASVPSESLAALEPDYRRAPLYDLLYANLTDLHLSLDQIRQSVAPPDDSMLRLEQEARRQAIGAMHLYKMLDRIAVDFIRSGGTVLVPDGEPSDKIFPDSTLRPFGEIRFLIVESDLSRISQVLKECGFEPASASNSPRYSRTWEVRSAEPVLTDRMFPMTLDIEVVDSPLRLFRACDPVHTEQKKSIAARLIWSKFHGPPDRESGFSAQLKVFPLPPEQLLVCLGASLGRQARDRLFGLCSLLEFFRGYPHPVNWDKALEAAKSSGYLEPAGNGLLMVREIVGRDRIPAEIVDGFSMTGTGPRVLETARHDPSVRRYGGLKRLFYFLYCLLSLEQPGDRVKYLFGSLFGSTGRRRTLVPALLRDVLKTLLDGFHHERKTVRDFAYWVERDPVKPSQVGR